MTASTRLGRTTSFLVVVVCLAVNDVGAADTEDPCANVDAFTTDEPALKVLYDQARILCAQRKVRAVSDLNKTEKQKAIAEGLAAFATIPAKEGVITKPETADHIGIWQAQRTLFDAAASVGEGVGKTIPEGKKYLVLTDPSALKQRSVVRAAIAQFDALKNQLEAMSGLLAKTSVRPSEPTFAGPTIPAAIPSLVTAAQALFSIAKTDLALFALTSPAQKEVIWAGLCSKGCPGMVIPAAATGAVETNLQKSYSVLLNAATKARKTYGDAQDQIEKAGGDQRVSTNVKLLRDGLAAQLAEYDALVRSLQAVQPDKTTTLFEDLTQLALETLGPSDISGTLLVTPSAFGGHGGVKSSMWRNDRILFETTAALSYTLFNADGTVLKAGFVAKGNSSIRDPQRKALEP